MRIPPLSHGKHWSSPMRLIIAATAALIVVVSLRPPSASAAATSVSVVNFTLTITGDANLPNAIVVDYSGGTDRYEIQDGFQSVSAGAGCTLAGSIARCTNAGNAITAVVINVGAGASDGDDQVDLHSSNDGTSITTGAGADFVAIGNGNLDNADGAYVVDGGGGSGDVLVVDDHLTARSDTFTMTSTTVERPGAGHLGITHTAVESVTLSAQTGDNIINVSSTAPTTETQVLANAGEDTVVIGVGDLDAVAGAVIVSGGPHPDEVIINDTLTPASQTYEFNSGTLVRGGFDVLNTSDVENYTINASNASATGDLISVHMTLAGTATTVNAGAGDDHVRVAYSSGVAADVAGAVTAHGDAGADSIALWDDLNATGKTYTIDDPSVTATGGFGGLTYGTMEALDVNGSTGNGIYNIQSSATTAISIVTGGADDQIAVNAENLYTLQETFSTGAEVIWTMASAPVNDPSDIRKPIQAFGVDQYSHPGALADADGDGLTNAAELAGFSEVYCAGSPQNVGAASVDSDCDQDWNFPGVLGDGCVYINDFGPGLDPFNPWDFFSAPIPSLHSGTGLVYRDNEVTAQDAQAIFAFSGTGSAETGGANYENDRNQNGVKDGWEYDRSSIGGGATGPPDGAVTAADAQLAFGQASDAWSCTSGYNGDNY